MGDLKPAKRLFIDLDGTLIDTMGVYADWVAQRLEVSRQAYLDLAGRSFDRQVKILRPDIDDAATDAVIAEFVAFKKAHLSTLEISGAVRSRLNAYRALGWHLILTSNNEQEVLDQVVPKWNLPFDAVLGYRGPEFRKGPTHFHAPEIQHDVMTRRLFIGDSEYDRSLTDSNPETGNDGDPHTDFIKVDVAGELPPPEAVDTPTGLLMARGQGKRLGQGPKWAVELLGYPLREWAETFLDSVGAWKRTVLLSGSAPSNKMDPPLPKPRRKRRLELTDARFGPGNAPTLTQGALYESGPLVICNVDHIYQRAHADSVREALARRIQRKTAADLQLLVSDTRQLGPDEMKIMRQDNALVFSKQLVSPVGFSGVAVLSEHARQKIVSISSLLQADQFQTQLKAEDLYQWLIEQGSSWEFLVCNEPYLEIDDPQDFQAAENTLKEDTAGVYIRPEHP